MQGESQSTDGVRTISIGGAAGDGIREAGVSWSEFFNALGFRTFSSFDYPSLIRGGHNVARISYNTTTVHADYAELDVLVAVNAETVQLHTTELKAGALVFVESTVVSAVQVPDTVLIELPMKQFATDLKAPLVARSSVALGAYAYTLGIPLEQVKAVGAVIFANLGPEMNIALLEKGYQHLENQALTKSAFVQPIASAPTTAIEDGNRAVAKGFVAAGLQAYVGYPMTPSTAVLQYLAKQTRTSGLIVVHPEDEIAVLNMALGMVYAGKRTAVGTANGGFALMQETFSFAGVSELPIALMISMRMGPATGVATHTSQGDLHFILHAGHGEFPRLVIAPGDVEECFYAAADVLNLAWKYQIPAILLSDKHLSESYMSVALDPTNVGVDAGKLARGTGPEYKRYTLTDDGVSPIAFPGTPNTVVKATSYEHNEEGEATEHANEVQAMQDKRFRKLDGLYREFQYFPTVKTYGDVHSDVVVVFWGSTKGAALEALSQLKRPVKLLQILWMEPFDADRVKEELLNASIIVDVEANHTAQLAALIREKTSIEITNKILKYDAQPFTPTALAEEINKFL